MNVPAAQAAALIAWFARARRELPWRREPRDPYRVLVSEVMLQQTQVDRVVPRFLAFVDRFPDLAALAAASDEEVTAAWSGLGYYRRARSLAALARQVVARSGGALPRTAGELLALPGIGPYTAAAVASFAHGEAVPVVDGNVLRVGARVLAIATDPAQTTARRAIADWAAHLVASADPAAVNEGLMELGATVCTPTSPACPCCPLAPWCRALADGLTTRLPTAATAARRQKLHWVAACAVAADGHWLLRQVDAGAILRGLWLPPFSELAGDDAVALAASLLPHPAAAPGRAAAPVRHSITYRAITVTPVAFAAAALPAPPGWRWTRPDEPHLATSTLLAKLAARVAGGGFPS